MSYRMTGRFVKETPKDAFDFVTIPHCKPARVKFNQYSAEVYIVCESIVKPAKGETTRTHNFRATNKALLREKVEAAFPTAASFTTSGNTQVVDEIANAKAALKQIRNDSVVVTQKMIEEARNRLVRVYGRGAEITLEKCRNEGISEQIVNALYKQEERKFISEYTAEHRRLAAEMSEADRRNYTQLNITEFMQKAPWQDWFKSYPHFFDYPDYSRKNFDTLFRYCEMKGQQIPLMGEIDAAMRYLLAHSHFYLQHAYPRTQRDAYRAVRPFVSIEPEVVPVDERQAAMDSMKGLTAKQLKENMQQIRNSNLTDSELRRRGQLLR